MRWWRLARSRSRPAARRSRGPPPPTLAGGGGPSRGGPGLGRRAARRARRARAERFVNRAADRVMNLESAVRATQAWRDAGERVVLANGVFDLVHVGHARYLAAARALGERLIVAVNGDASAAALKGPGRPIVLAFDRARVVAALRGVDA